MNKPWERPLNKPRNFPTSITVSWPVKPWDKTSHCVTKSADKPCSKSWGR